MIVEEIKSYESFIVVIILMAAYLLFIAIISASLIQFPIMGLFYSESLFGKMFIQLAFPNLPIGQDPPTKSKLKRTLWTTWLCYVVTNFFLFSFFM